MERLDNNTAIRVLEYLDQPIDIAHASLVSRSWRQFALGGRLWRRLCLAICPELEKLEELVEVGSVKCSAEAGPSEVSLQEILRKEHLICCHLYSQIIRSPVSCIKEAIFASSTDNFPIESIHETLHPEPKVDRPAGYRPGWSYWSSKGHWDANVPETLTYRLRSPLCVVDEIKIRPFQANFQQGDPIYSAKFVRFRLGYHHASVGNGSTFEALRQYIWTYESPKYPMQQVDVLQSFKLPHPVLCVGQILQVELLGRVQAQQSDLLYYICVCHVMVMGRPIANFDFRHVGDHGGYVLIYARTPSSLKVEKIAEENFVTVPPRQLSFCERARQLRFGHRFWWSRVLPGERMLLVGDDSSSGIEDDVTEDEQDDGANYVDMDEDVHLL